MRAVPICDREVRAHYLAQLSAADERLGSGIERIGALVVDDPENYVPVSMSDVYQLSRALRRDGYGLLHEGVYACLYRVRADLDVRIVRRRYDDCVGGSRIYQFAMIGEGLDSPLALGFGTDGRIDVADRGKLRPGHCSRREIRRMARPHPSCSDDRNSHCFSSSFWLNSYLIADATTGRLVVTLATPQRMNRDSCLYESSVNTDNFTP